MKQWHHVLAVFDSLEPYKKVRIYLDGQKQTLKVNNGRLFRQFSNGRAPPYRRRRRTRMALPGDDRRSPNLQSSAGRRGACVLSCPDPLSRIAAIPTGAGTEAQRLKIRNAFLEQQHRPKRGGHGRD